MRKLHCLYANGRGLPRRRRSSVSALRCMFHATVQHVSSLLCVRPPPPGPTSVFDCRDYLSYRHYASTTCTSTSTSVLQPDILPANHAQARLVLDLQLYSTCTITHTETGGAAALLLDFYFYFYFTSTHTRTGGALLPGSRSALQALRPLPAPPAAARPSALGAAPPTARPSALSAAAPGDGSSCRAGRRSQSTAAVRADHPAAAGSRAAHMAALAARGRGGWR